MHPKLDRFALTAEDVHRARRRIRPHVLQTPLVEAAAISRELHCRVLLKCENLQHAGSFKARGASNAVFALDASLARQGVVTHSSGNHAAALARAAALRDIPAHIVMPRNSRENKIAAVRAFGVNPVLCEPDAASRRNTADALRIQTGATLIHPYDAPAVIAGQGTVGLELAEQCSEMRLDAVVVPVGGGGLLSGMLIALKSWRPDLPVVAAEPALADDAARSLRSGRIEMPTRHDTIADGLRTPLGELTFPVIQALLDDILLVDEQTIEAATRLIARKARLIAEPSGAVALGAVLQHRSRFEGQNLVVVVSGGNLDFNHFELKEKV